MNLNLIENYFLGLYWNNYIFQGVDIAIGVMKNDINNLVSLLRFKDEWLEYV
ncbi:hypothetical protein [Persicobacter diffluens]|uniref:Uncharacterized protein n=1 Tax=Persicobacter diffluens TaxID=981 RepID=A0AAN4VV28_9BACT|nr:hypothetical protein PEDI_01630 [Persicobacter diffluens]